MVLRSIVASLVLGAGLVTAPAAAYPVRGGDAFSVGASARCTIGASVAGGYVIAGDCATVGSTVKGFNGVTQGTVAGASFPGRSMGWVRVNSSWTPRGVVSTGTGEVRVTGTQLAPIGASVCRSGSATGWRCGTLTRRNITVTFPQGSLHGLIETNICAEPGDKGAPLMYGGHLQGILVGASGNCSTGGRSYYQPIIPILQAYGLTLLSG
ncbi:S1 family peptidase [Nonomuraea typhae]|uniref:S1 family peptidase n=1 Tax=Nonomuraea typhae TaxID=2603600 RepID=UPI0012F7E052|nr:S1 family peptidase [Nonomuraea typhae]